MPDTGDFRRKAQADLNRIEKSLTVEVGTKIDMTGAKREMLEVVRKINAENRARWTRARSASPPRTPRTE
jgi:hypothetical protein